MAKVRKVIKFKAFLGGNDEVLREYKSGSQEYDARGNMVREVHYSPDGAIEIANGYTYDDEDRLIEEIHYYGEEAGEIIKYKLDAEGRRLSEETAYAEGSVSVKHYIRTGHTLIIKSEDEDGDVESEEVLKKDERGNVIEEARFDEDGRLEFRFVNTFDKDNLLISRTEFDGKETIVRKVEIEYNTQGHPIIETHRNRKGELIDRISFSFDEKGNRTEWQNSIYLNRTTFDGDNRPLRVERLNRRNNLVEQFTEYTYDPDGRMLSEKTFSMGEEYELEPGAVTRTRSDFVLNRYTYEFHE